jgi:UrcA family protein
MSRNNRLTLALTSLFLMSAMSACTEVATASAIDNTIEVSTRRVKFGDLDLSHSQGAAALYTRIHSAARDVCRAPAFIGKFESQNATETCIQHAIDRAVTEVDAPLLTTYYLAKSGRTPLLAKQ